MHTCAIFPVITECCCQSSERDTDPNRKQGGVKQTLQPVLSQVPQKAPMQRSHFVLDLERYSSGSMASKEVKSPSVKFTYDEVTVPLPIKYVTHEGDIRSAGHWMQSHETQSWDARGYPIQHTAVWPIQ